MAGNELISLGAGYLKVDFFSLQQYEFNFLPTAI
jgi:hypothetical protein